MATREIRTSHGHVSCDVCGRTLLRGEQAETYIAGGARREVCELCTPRAVHEGWVREGLALERGTRGPSGQRRRSLLSRLRGRAEAPARGAEPPAPAAPRARRNGWHPPAWASAEPPASDPAPEPRHVRAVPTSAEHRVQAALERFNASEHPRTIAGVARSLGAPSVLARPSQEGGSLVTIVVAWELCWYRYEVDVAEDGAVRPAGQGYELAELAPHEHDAPNAVADEYGTLAGA
jgi:hypothetical protein